MEGVLPDERVVNPALARRAPARGSTATANAAISVITLGELRAGVVRAHDPCMRASRQARLTAVRAAFTGVPVDESIAEHYGDVLAHARHAGRTVRASDLLIIATASATGRTLYTLDRAQAGLARELGLTVSAGA